MPLRLARRGLSALALCNFVLSCSSRGLGRHADSSALPEVSGPVDNRLAGESGTADSGMMDGTADIQAPDVYWGTGAEPGCTGLRTAPHVSILVHLRLLPSDLLGATATVCRAGLCTTSTYRAPEGDRLWSGFVSDDRRGEAMVEDERDGFSLVDFSFQLEAGTFADGDVYRVKIVDANQRTLIDVRRPVRYDLENYNPRCGNPGDRYAILDLYPESPSDITCDNNHCIHPGVHLTGSAPSPDPHAPITVTLCRNGACSAGTTTLGPCPGATCVVGNSLSGAYLGTLEAQLKGEGIAFDVGVSADSAALVDGDAYTVTVAQGANTLVSKKVTVSYSAEYLNGPRCDPVPCRHAIVDLDSLP